MSFPEVNGMQEQPVKKGMNKKLAAVAALLPVAVGLLAFAFVRGGGKSEAGEAPDSEGKKSKRDIADQEKRKLTPSEMGKKGAAKRWAKKAEEEGDNDKDK